MSHGKRTSIRVVLSLVASVVLATASHAQPMCGDVNDSETVTSVDALLVLRQSVGQPVALECPDFLAHYGFEEDRGFTAGWNPDYLFGTRVSVATSVTVTHLGLYSRQAGTHAKMALYSDNENSPATLLAGTTGSELTVGRNEIAVTEAEAISPGFYWIMVVLDAHTDIGANDEATDDNVAKYRALAFTEALPASFGPAETETGHTFDFWMRVVQ